MTAADRQFQLPFALVDSLKNKFQNIVILSGAGISAESGIPTFRSGHNGLWSEFNPSDLATPQAWKKNKALVWGWYEWRRGLVSKAEPNLGHIAVASLQKRLGAAVITQNVDDLHERAGAEDVTHLHGSIFSPRCDSCSAPYELPSTGSADDCSELEPPRCLVCSGYIRPGVVWFGEALPAREFGSAKAAVSQSDLLIVVGTSGQVQPAASLVEFVSPSTIVVEVNPASTPHADGMTYRLRITAGVGMPMIAAALMGSI